MKPTKTPAPRRPHTTIRISRKAHAAIIRLAGKNKRSIIATIDILAGVK